MLEIFVLIMLLCLFAACVFSPAGGNVPYFFKSNRPAASAVRTGTANTAAEEPVSFLAYLRNQIEAELFPRPTCSVLQRHYDALVTAELQNRLTLMTK